MSNTKSGVYFAAANAAEKALPELSKALIDRHDELHRAYGETKWAGPVPEELQAALAAVDADELAAFAMECRKRGNMALHEEWRANEESLAATRQEQQAKAVEA